MAVRGGDAGAPTAKSPTVHLKAAKNYPKLWNEEELFKVPKMTPATDLKFDFEYAENVKPIYLEGIDYQGKPTRFFAWLGLPKMKSVKKGAKVPGVVLVHGGGGTAYTQWVEEWTERGYAAIAMDTVGCRPVPTHICAPFQRLTPTASESRASRGAAI